MYEAIESVAAPESRVSDVLRRRKYSGSLPAQLASNSMLLLSTYRFHDCRERFRWEIEEERKGRGARAEQDDRHEGLGLSSVGCVAKPPAVSS